MRVGPRSAGADPGPAAYGRGGTEPAMTDAAARCSGHAQPGRARLGDAARRRRSQAAVATIAGAIGKDVTETAISILRVSAAAMANAMREVTVEQGLNRAVTDQRRGPADGDAARRRIADDADDRPAARRQLLGLGAARRRHGAVRSPRGSWTSPTRTSPPPATSLQRSSPTSAGGASTSATARPTRRGSISAPYQGPGPLAVDQGAAEDGSWIAASAAEIAGAFVAMRGYVYALFDFRTCS